MKQLICEMCGGTGLIKQDGVFVCQNCGTKYSIEEAKKMMIEGTVNVQGSVEIDYSSRINNLYKLAEIDIDKHDCGNAQKYYESILIEEPTSWKAHFFISYIKVWNSKKVEILRVTNDFCNNYNSLMKMIKEYVNVREQSLALETVFDRSKKLLNMLNNAIMSMYNEDLAWKPFISSQPDLSDIYNARCKKKNHDENARKEMICRSEIVYKIMSVMGDEIHSTFGENSEVHAFAVDAWKEYVDGLSNFSNFSQTAQQELIIYSEKIKKYDPDYSSVSVVSDTSKGNGVSKEKMVQIEQALNNNNKYEAIKIYRDCSGLGLADAKLAVDKLMVEKGLKKEPTAESKISIAASKTVNPFTCFMAFQDLLFDLSKAKEENGGFLSEKAKQDLIKGIVWFGIWFLVFLLVFCSLITVLVALE